MWYKLTIACLWILFRGDENRHYPALKLAIEQDMKAMRADYNARAAAIFAVRDK